MRVAAATSQGQRGSPWARAAWRTSESLEESGLPNVGGESNGRRSDSDSGKLTAV